MSVTMMRASLTTDDIARLVGGDDPQDRAQSAQKVCRRIAEQALGPQDRAMANEILGILAADSATLVRQALSTTLKNSPHLPRALAVKLAEDVHEIAAPILSESPALTDEDLIAIVRAGDVLKQTAVAGRERVSAAVVDVIVEEGEEPAVVAAAANPGAEFKDETFDAALNRFGDNEALTDAMISRPSLPATVTERLVAMVTDAALDRLAQRHALPPQLAVELSEGARERATIDILDQAAMAVDMDRFVQQLALNGRLTPSLILRGMCMGHMRFFEHAIAELAGVPHEKAWLLIHDAGPLGLRAVFERAGLPQRLFLAVRTAVDVYHDVEAEGFAHDRARFSQTMIERVLTRHQGMPADELAYLLDKLNALGGRPRDAA